MKNIFCFLFIGMLSLNLVAQNNKAKSILDKVSAKNKEYKTIMADFTFSMDNKEEDIHEVSEGKIILKGDKYRLKLMGVDTYFDGTTIYSYLIDADEVSIKEPDEDDDEALNPAKIFSIYENGFTYKYVGEENTAKGNYHLIDLFPDNTDRGFSSIRLKINAKTNQIESLKSIGKDGNNISIVLKKLIPNLSYSDSDFIFDTKANPDVEINDMR
ncbi:LolA family protein [Ancylomarina longa]|uniref:Outer membrane lipoprotein carrier protein LolA n=1 Tax=Ancylomarina longa TaxID=2487017 RepID=A0A434AXH2_9BACT|nr:outer membrane lipoprotein carrier protein LolA [Ancylomarina longa]RUT79231.1 outer membrane lipoprotein carrier protein LolA [Ancylomarina longa]